MTSTIALQRGRDERFTFVLFGDDGTELLRGLPCFSRNQAQRSAEKTLRCLTTEERVFLHQQHGQHYYLVHEDHNEMIARSPHMLGPQAATEILAEAREVAPRVVFEGAKDPH